MQIHVINKVAAGGLSIVLFTLTACPGDDVSGLEADSGGTDEIGDDTESGPETTDESTDETTEEGIPTGTCGDGIVGEDEACDMGASNNDNAMCTTDCELNICGDGLIYEGVELCDDGLNDGSYDGCTPDCQALGPHCGDGLVDEEEPCDYAHPEKGVGCNLECEWDCSNNPQLAVSNINVQSENCSKQNGLITCITDGGVHEATVTWDLQNDMINLIPVQVYVSFEMLNPGNFDPGFAGGEVICLAPDLQNPSLFNCSITYYNFPLFGFATGKVFVQTHNSCAAESDVYQDILWSPNPG